MSAIREAVEIRSRLVASHPPNDVTRVLKRLPSAVRRMGAVRCLQWLCARKHKNIGARLVKEMAPHVGMPPTVEAAVLQLEGCDHRALFRHHRALVRLFDALAVVDRVGCIDAS